MSSILHITDMTLFILMLLSVGYFFIFAFASLWGTNKKYSKFNANVIISEGEQTEKMKKELKDLKVEKHKEVKF